MTTESNLRKATELRVDQWIDSEGEALDKPLKLADLGQGWKIIYCFQHWCPGCHSHGFPTLKYLHERLNDRGVGFAVIQTVFEGSDVNTYDKLKVNQEKYGLAIPFGHDAGTNGRSAFMADYSTGGTPWFTLIDPDGNIAFNDFRLNPDGLIKLLDEEMDEVIAS